MKIVFLFFLGVTNAHASTPLRFCADLSTLRDHVQSCEDNQFYAAQGILCMKKLKSDVDKAASDLGKTLSAQISAQNQSFDTSGANFQAARAKIDSLLALVALSKGELREYKRNLLLPEDADNPEITGPNLGDFLQANECYADQQEVLDMVLADVDVMEKELRMAREVASLSAADMEEKSANVQALPATAVQPQGYGQGSITTPAARPSGSSPSAGSGISGIEEDRRKREQK